MGAREQVRDRKRLEANPGVPPIVRSFLQYADRQLKTAPHPGLSTTTTTSSTSSTTVTPA
jgi:hypothetical protein